jgi:bidirectional [NiFe] hydrogenase diaphorase subunit
MVKLFVDDREIEVKKGTTLLQACLDNDIFIPNLCYLKELESPAASCRMCFVEIEGQAGPLAACTIPVSANMVVKTDTPAVRQLQRTALRLLLSVHHVDCKNCAANKKCELQRLAKFLKVGLKPKQLDNFLKEPAIVQDHPCLDYYPNRCVLCGKCYHICRKYHSQSSLTFTKRGIKTVIHFYAEENPADLDCRQCQRCVDICPVGALILRSDL